MNNRIPKLIAITLISALFAGCGGGSDSAPITSPPPPPPPPPPTPESVSGIWTGTATLDSAPDVNTSFEADMTGPFTIGTTPYAATFSDGTAMTAGDPTLYVDGTFAWHVSAGTTADVAFETPPQTLSFWARTVSVGDVVSIEVIDLGGNVLDTIVPTVVYQEFSYSRAIGESIIGSMRVTHTSGDDLVIDDMTFGYPGGSAQVRCVIAETSEYACHDRDDATNSITSGATGTLAVANGNEVSGAGSIIAQLGKVLADGSNSAASSVANGVIAAGTTLDFTSSHVGVPATITMIYDTDYDRPSDLATIAASYSTLNVFGNSSSLNIDAAGLMDGAFTTGGGQNCNFIGQASIIDAAVNAYDVNLTVSSCGARDGVYDGLGFTRDVNATDDRFVFRVYNLAGTVTSAVFGIGEATK